MLLDSFRILSLCTQEFLFLDPVYSRFVDSRSYFDRSATFLRMDSISIKYLIKEMFGEKNIKRCYGENSYFYLVLYLYFYKVSMRNKYIKIQASFHGMTVINIPRQYPFECKLIKLCAS